MLAGLVLGFAPQQAVPVAASSFPALDHVFVVVMENHAFGEIIGSPSAPYINSLAATGGVATSYYAVAHPSLPNYLALTGGSTYGISSDCTMCWVSATNLADNLEAAGKSWKAYEESMPSPCFVGDSYPYAQKHNPFIYFNNIRNNASRCQGHIVPYTQLASDLGSTSTTPNFAFITPNMCSDMHDCSVGSGDAWLTQNLPTILMSPAFTTQRSVLMVLWDEDDWSAGNQVPLLMVGNAVTSGFRSTSPFNHYSALRTVEAGLGLNTLTGNDGGAAPMSEFFSLSGWSRLGGVATSTPVAVSNGAGGIDVFVRGTDSGVWRLTWNGTSWGNWQPLGGGEIGDPGAIALGARTDVFVRGTDNQLWVKTASSGMFGSWQPLGGLLTSGVDADAWTAGTVHEDVYGRGSDGQLWHKWGDNGTWYGWEPLGGVLSSDPGAISSRQNRIDVFVRGSDLQLWHRWYDGGTWYGWEPLGGVLTSAPDAASCAAGHLDVLVIGTDGQVWRKGYDGSSWTNWQPLGGYGATGIFAVCAAATLQLFAAAPSEVVIQSTAAAS